MHDSRSVDWPCWRPDIYRKTSGPSLVQSSENPLISVFGFQVSASRLTAFHALQLTGVGRVLAHSGCSKHQAGDKTSCNFFFRIPFHLSELLTVAFWCELALLKRYRPWFARGYDNPVHRDTPWMARSARPPSTEQHFFILACHPKWWKAVLIYFCSIVVRVWFLKLTPAWNIAQLGLKSPVTMFQTPPTMDMLSLDGMIVVFHSMSMLSYPFYALP